LSFTANDYIVDAAELYGDTDYDRVETTDWIRYLNAAIRALILVRPDAGSVTEAVQLVAGVKQDKPSDALRLLDISRNLGTDGDTPGRIVTPAKREHIDYSNLLWTADSGESYIENFSYDINKPDIFYVTPPVSSTVDVYVEMVTSQLPTAVTATTSDPGINDVFFEAVINFMLYRAFAADDEGVEFSKAMTYLQNFFNLLQVEMSTASAFGPEVKE
jgi:hypothetical protein